MSSLVDGYYHSYLPESSPWLKVDLGRTLVVVSVTVYHRIDYCMEEFKNAVVTLEDVPSGGASVQCGDTYVGPLPANTPYSVFHCGGTPIRATELTITLQGTATLHVNKLAVKYSNSKLYDGSHMCR